MEYQSPVFGWHITNHTVYTLVTMETFSDDNSKVDKDSVKYRFIIPMHLLSPEEKDQAMKDFTKYGRDWQP